MTRSTPTIHGTTLLFSAEGQATSIVVGSAQWFEWLGKETTRIFSFQARDSSSYTARKERAGNRRGAWYWKAYRTYQRRLYRAYLGKSEELTLARLDEIAQTLSTRIHDQKPEKQDASRVGHRVHLPPHHSRSDTLVVPLLETKLHPPQLPALLVDRSRLLTLLDIGQRQKLTLLQAPAGFGKTTLVTQWIAYRQAEVSQQSPEPVAWISLDNGDNDPVRFWSSIIMACQTFHTHLGQTALAHLSQASRSPFSSASLETALSLLLNDLGRSDALGVLILEDYHLIEHARIHETMVFFIEHLPASLHVVILARSEPPLPLVRWRARGDLLEVSSHQLRFSVGETADFLQQVLPQAFSQEAARSLHTYLEGWPAGLRLLALSLQGHQTPQALADALSELSADQTHRSIQEFFLAEIFNAQPEPLQAFLLQTSLLSRLTGSLCDAITGRQQSDEWLKMIERSGFFLEALDSAGRWYRYHGLWAATMRTEASRRLGEEELRHLSARASRWYAEHAKGTIIATRFIGGGREISGFRKCTLGRIARNRSQTGIMAENEQDNADLWRKLRQRDEALAHLVSARIVGFAAAHGASIVVFEHLGNLQPEKGRYSRRGNTKRAYWMKGRIFRYARYKAWNLGIITSRVNPRNTSRECHRCHGLVVRYHAGQRQEGYTRGASLVLCPQCQMRDHADRNASLRIGQRLLERSQEPLKGKPQTAGLCSGRVSKETGVTPSQDAKRQRGSSLSQARHGDGNAHGTAQEGTLRMDERPSDIPPPLRVPLE